MAKSAKKAATKTVTTPPKKAAKKTATEAPKKAAPKKATSKQSAAKANPGLMAPLNVSDTLAKVIGSDPTPRPQIIKKIWDYIKLNDLQDKDNRRMINADEKLKEVFGGKTQITMFELAKVVNNHIK